MARMEGCVQAKEISLTRRGANPHAHVLVLKKLATPAEVKKVETEMPELTQADVTKAALAITNKVFAMSDVAKKHYLALDEAGQSAFLEKSTAEQEEIAKAASDAAETARVAAEAAKSGITPQVLELQKSNSDLKIEIEALKAGQVERDLEKRADTEFSGFPGGSKAAVERLKSISKLPEGDRKGFEEMMKAQCQLAAASTQAFGGRTEADITKAQSAMARIEKKVVEVMAEKKLERGDAFELVVGLQEFAEDVAAING